MQNDDKKEVPMVTSVPEVNRMPETVGSSAAGEPKLYKLKNWWRRRSVFEKEFCSFVALPTLLTFGYFALIADVCFGNAVCSQGRR